MPRKRLKVDSDPVEAGSSPEQPTFEQRFEELQRAHLPEGVHFIPQDCITIEDHEKIASSVFAEYMEEMDLIRLEMSAGVERREREIARLERKLDDIRVELDQTKRALQAGFEPSDPEGTPEYP